MTAKLRILLADDHAILRDGLVALVQAECDMEVVAQAKTGQEAVQQALRLAPDVAVLDVSMPDLSGAEAAELIRQCDPNIHIVALTRHADQGYMQRMFRAGASGYVLKRSAGGALISAIRAVVTGGTWIDPALAGKLVGRGSSEWAPPQSSEPATSLTEREEQVLKLIAWGQSNKEAANELGLSTKTVESYKATALKKLNLRSRTEILRHALGKGWLGNESDPE